MIAPLGLEGNPMSEKRPALSLPRLDPFGALEVCGLMCCTLLRAGLNDISRHPRWGG